MNQSLVERLRLMMDELQDVIQDPVSVNRHTDDIIYVDVTSLHVSRTRRGKIRATVTTKLRIWQRD